MEIQKRMDELVVILNEANYQYYVLDDPKMLDFEYDHLLRELEDLERDYPQFARDDSPTKRVGGAALSKFEKVEHPVPLMSLQDVFSLEELDEFIDKIRESYPDASFSVEPKIDGLSVALEYIDGKFVRGATRGDGNVGEDVTENVKTIHSVPMRLEGAPSRLIVRGEVFMPKKSFEALNAQQELEGKPLFANPRNAAAGSLRQLDPKIAAKRGLDILIFNIQLADGISFKTHSESLDYLRSLHFKVVSSPLFSRTEDINHQKVAFKITARAVFSVRHTTKAFRFKIREDLLRAFIKNVVTVINNDFGNRTGKMRFSKPRRTDKQKVLHSLTVKACRVSQRTVENALHIQSFITLVIFQIKGFKILLFNQLHHARAFISRII